MRSYEFPYPEAEQQTVVSRFGGIDCRTHPTKVSLSRSPDMQNMICDQNDFLVKRTGWRTQAQFNAPIYGLFAMPDGVGCAVHAGTKLYFRAPDGTQTELPFEAKNGKLIFTLDFANSELPVMLFRLVPQTAAL